MVDRISLERGLNHHAIIGSNGFIGSALKRYADTHYSEQFLSKWHGITRENYMGYRGNRFNRVIWAAGNPSKEYCQENPERCMYDNAYMVLEALKDFPAYQFIYISSQAVYTGEQREDSFIDIAKLDTYGLSKYVGELMVKDFCGSHQIDYIIIRPNGFTGPGLKKNIVHEIATGYTLKKTWDSRAQYIHVDTFADIVLFLTFNRYLDYKILNVAPPDVLTPVDIARILNKDLTQIKQPSNGNVRHTDAVMDVTKMFNLLNKYKRSIPTSERAVRLWNEPAEVSMSVLRGPMGESCRGRGSDIAWNLSRVRSNKPHGINTETPD